MNRRTTFIRGTAFILFACAIPIFAADEAPPSAATILDRYIEVTGGKAAYEKRKATIETSRLEFPALGLKGTLVAYSSEPDNYYSSLDLPGVGKVEMGMSGGVAWENSALSGPRIKTGEERLQALREARMNSSYHWRDLYPKAETQGTETVDGEDCYKILLTPLQGTPVTMYFEKKSGLLRRTTLTAASPLGGVPADIVASGYREFGGVLIPAKVTQKAAGQEFTIIVEDVKVNPEIPPGRFDLPAEIKALLNKK